VGAVIDIHTHICFNANSKNGVGVGDTNNYLATPDELLPIMDRKNIRVMVNLTSGSGKALDDAIAKYQNVHPDRFVMFTEPWWVHANEPGYAKIQADEIVRAHKVGAKGLKILKTLGLYLRENVTTGPLVKIDDPRFDPMWEACGSLGMPVAIHVSDPEAFFLPIDRFNERFEELNNHPDWSFYGKDYPSNMELLEARNRMIARHPKTQFIVLHVGNDAENLGYVSECMDKYPNMHVEIAARIGELGRQPRQSRKTERLGGSPDLRRDARQPRRRVPHDGKQAVEEERRDRGARADPQQRDHEYEDRQRRDGLQKSHEAEQHLTAAGIARRRDAQRHRHHQREGERDSHQL